MKKNIALKIRIYPNKGQRIMIDKNIGCVRYMYNHLLAMYNETKKIASYKEVYNDDNKFLLESDTSSYSNEQVKLKSAIKNHYNNPSHFGSPTYKSKHNKKQSYTTSVTNNNSRVLDNKHIRIPKVGVINAKVHRLFGSNYKLKSVTISKEVDYKYYASLLYEYEKELIENQNDSLFTHVLGIDYSQDKLGVLSTGEYLEYPKYLLKSMDNLKELQKKLSRCILHSNNWYKRKLELARIHIKIRNQRKDYLNKLAKNMSLRFDVIVIEDLDLQEMSKNHHLGKKIYDNSYGMFINKLGYKLEQSNKTLLKVDRYFPSSKLCSKCGNMKNDLKLSDRTYTCNCGNIIDRDYNASLNIAMEGIKILAEQAIAINI